MAALGNSFRVAIACAIGAGVAGSVPAFADVLVFQNGRTMSIRGHAIEGETITVTLLGGGAATFTRAIVARIEPETIPADPEPEVVTTTETLPTADHPEPAERPFGALIQEVADRHGVDARLVHAVVEAESNYQPRARSVRGARGLMQVLPSTGMSLGARNLYDPLTNLDAGVRYLRGLLREFDLPEALAAYNAGPATVRRYGGIPPYLETQRYVRRVLQGAGR